MALSYNNIVVAVDGSKEANYAFKKAKEMAKRHEAALHLVNVIDTRSFAAIEAYDRSVAERAQAHSEELLADYKKQAEEYGITDVKVVIEHGSPKTIITRELSNLTDADLIVCGATGLNAIERFLIGSVSEAIVRSATCDVLVVRTPEN
ncbi:universal stress protein [Caryophanon latum]|uniref:Universal stress protein n=1 Tax=Caryophanon latum TaxID=33977 RepID=A0A1C0Z0Y3_9BACL|nr:universal stress protein [Caryophanon latum]OCS93018.1 universal stress protein UspA [Caryophanon latum]